MTIFVSYSSSNRERVEALVVALGELGYDVQYELKTVGSQIRWQQVFEGIQECDLFIAAETPELLKSYTFEIENSYARALGKPILYVVLDSPTRPVKSKVDFRMNNRNRKRDLGSALQGVPPPFPLPNPLPMPANWVSPLAELRSQVETLGEDFNTQAVLVLRLREFLERQESFPIASSLIELLRTNPYLHPEIANEIDSINDEAINIQTTDKKSRQKRGIVVGLVLAAMMIVIVFLIGSQISQLRENRSIMALLTRTAEAGAQSQTAISQVSVTPETVKPTETTAVPQVIPPTATIGVTLATNTEMPTVAPSATSTSVPTQVASWTNTPQPVVPSSTFTLTPRPPTVTPRPPTATATATLTYTPTTVPPSATPPLQFPPTQTPKVDLQSFPQAVYVGMNVEDTPQGIRVLKVGETAAAAGVHEGDYVLAVDLTDVATREQFLNVMNTRTTFARIALRVRQTAGIVTLTVVLGVTDFALPTPAP